MPSKKTAVEPDEVEIDEPKKKLPRQREIAVSEFFAKNRHLLGFDSPQKALLTAVREAVDNALDACEEARILPDITVEITELAENRYNVRIEDNGPGIPKSEMGKIFAKLLYGSKFHRLKQSRGQQGIGISAAVMYAQMTTGEPALITSKMKGARANHIRLLIDTTKNQPKAEFEGHDDSDWWKGKAHGTSIALIMSGQMKGGRHGIEAYLKQTALANPHARMLYKNHKLSTKSQMERGADTQATETMDVPRVVHGLPKEPEEIKPHPHGLELGTLQRLLQEAGKQQLATFMTTSFSRVTAPLSSEMTTAAALKPTREAQSLDRTESERLFKAIQNQKLSGPPTSCLSPIGEEALIKGLFALFGDRKNLQDDDELEHLAPEKEKPKAPLPVFDEPPAQTAALLVAKLPGKKAQGSQQISLFSRVAAPSTLPMSVTTQLPSASTTPPTDAASLGKAKIETDEDGAQILALGESMFVTAVTRPPAVYRGNPFQVEVGVLYSKELPSDELAKVFRFANRVPLLYQASACSMMKSIVSAPWRSYEVQQSKGAPPTGPLVILVHIASVWVPYTSESKEAIAHYPEVIKELRLAVMEAGRRLQRFLRRKKRDMDELKKRDYITKYLDPIGEALRDILGLTTAQTNDTLEHLKVVLENSRVPATEAERKAKRAERDDT